MTDGEDARAAQLAHAAELVGKRVRFKGLRTVYAVDWMSDQGLVHLSHPDLTANFRCEWAPSLFEVVEP